MHTFSEENYLRSIYVLGLEGNNKISPTAIAELLQNNPASVIDMLKKLVEKKLITYEKSKGVKLSDKGKKAALAIIRKHRLWEVFLLEKLNYKWDAVHGIANQLEHVNHPELADRLDEFLGFPKYDPHGNPIPEASGEMADVHRKILSEIDEGKTVQVVGVKDTSAPFLQYLQKLNIQIGTKIKLLEKIAFDESLRILIGKNEKINVSKQFAENIFVEQVNS